MPGRHIADHQARLFMDWADHIRPAGVGEGRTRWPASSTRRRRHPEQGPDVRRTPERRIRGRKAQHGADKEVMFRQLHAPGRMAPCPPSPARPGPAAPCRQEARAHALSLPPALVRLPACRAGPGGESFTALAEGLQAAPWQPGGAPREHRAGYLSAGFRNHRKEDAGDMTGCCRLLCGYYRMKPCPGSRGMAREMGAIESAHGHPEREIGDALMIRGSREFADEGEYRNFIAGTAMRCNARRAAPIRAEREQLHRLPNMRTSDHEETSVTVTSASGFILKRVFYTVPSRLIGHRLGVRIHDDRLALCPGTVHQLTVPRKRKGPPAKAVHVANHRHVIHSPKTGPMALTGLVCSGELFPRQAFRRCFEMAMKAEGERAAFLQAVKLPVPDRLRARIAPAAGVMPAAGVTRAVLPGHGSCVMGRTDDAAGLDLMLTELRLPVMRELWKAFAERSDAGGWPASRFLATLAGHEIAERRRRRIQRHPGEARLLPGKRLAGFDFGAVPVISKAQVMAPAAGDARLARGASCLLFGPPGTGKAIRPVRSDWRLPGADVPDHRPGAAPADGAAGAGARAGAGPA